MAIALALPVEASPFVVAGGTDSAPPPSVMPSEYQAGPSGSPSEIAPLSAEIPCWAVIFASAVTVPVNSASQFGQAAGVIGERLRGGLRGDAVQRSSPVR